MFWLLTMTRFSLPPSVWGIVFDSWYLCSHCLNACIFWVRSRIHYRIWAYIKWCCVFSQWVWNACPISLEEYSKALRFPAVFTALLRPLYICRLFLGFSCTAPSDSVTFLLLKDTRKSKPLSGCSGVSLRSLFPRVGNGSSPTWQPRKDESSSRLFPVLPYALQLLTAESRPWQDCHRPADVLSLTGSACSYLQPEWEVSLWSPCLLNAVWLGMAQGL